MARYWVHVNQHFIKANRKAMKDFEEGRLAVLPSPRPVLTCKGPWGTRYGMEVTFTGPCRAIYRPLKPKSCGAEVWMETDHDILIQGEMTYAEAKALVGEGILELAEVVFPQPETEPMPA